MFGSVGSSMCQAVPGRRCRSKEGQDDGWSVRGMRDFYHWPSSYHVVVISFQAAMLTLRIWRVTDTLNGGLEATI